MFGPYSLHGNKGQTWGLHDGSGGLDNNILMSTYFKQRKKKSRVIWESKGVEVVFYNTLPGIGMGSISCWIGGRDFFKHSLGIGTGWD